MTTERANAITWIVAAIALLALGAGGGYWWAHRTMATNGSMSGATVSSAAPNATDPMSGNGSASGKRKILYWHDPMVPGQKFDKPGKSPFMDMQLVPVYADEAGEGRDVRVNPTVVQNLG